MMRRAICLIAIVLLAGCAASPSSPAPAPIATAIAAQPPVSDATRCNVCARDSRGRLARSEKKKREFEAMTGHPGGWRGHVVDHVIALACGGADDPSNMQWQTIAEGHAKDRWERNGCTCCE